MSTRLETWNLWQAEKAIRTLDTNLSEFLQSAVDKYDDDNPDISHQVETGDADLDEMVGKIVEGLDPKKLRRLEAERRAICTQIRQTFSDEVLRELVTSKWGF